MWINVKKKEKLTAVALVTPIPAVSQSVTYPGGRDAAAASTAEIVWHAGPVSDR